MGVKSLWRIVAPYGEKVSVVTLQGKQIAVDLSGWICENKIVGEKQRTRHRNFYLRNIFFRTSVLLMANVTPVFVLDGDPPDIKQTTIIKRNQARFEYGKSQNILEEKNSQKVKGQRKILKCTLEECQQMLNFLGVCCLWSKGEGEALCALLNHEEVVEGVITQDSDAFLYGAKKVFRNFTAQDGFGTVEVYKMSDLEMHLNLSKEKLIAMSLLCGCDYDDTGIHGIGPEKSLKYLSNFKGDVLKRLKCVTTDEELEKYDIEKKSCKKCHHPGKQQDHTKLGCELCGTQTKCILDHTSFLYDNLSDEEKTQVDFELKLRNEVKSSPIIFPDRATINEYLNFRQEICQRNFTWNKVDIVGFLVFMARKCEWSFSYGFEKIIPVYCRWALMNSTFSEFSPCKILKKRVLKSVPSFDIQWIRKIDLRLYIDFEEDANIDLVTTTEPEALVMDKCKKLYDDYLTEVENKRLAKKKAKREKNTKPAVDDLVECVGRLSLRDKTSKKSKTSQKKNKKAQTISSSGLDKENIRNINMSHERTEECLSVDVTFEEKYDGFDLDDSNTVDYDLSGYEIDESLILNSIIARREYY